MTQHSKIDLMKSMEIENSRQALEAMQKQEFWNSFRGEVERMYTSRVFGVLCQKYQDEVRRAEMHALRVPFGPTFAQESASRQGFVAGMNKFKPFLAEFLEAVRAGTLDRLPEDPS